jgi:hypothetical protein
MQKTRHPTRSYRRYGRQRLERMIRRLERGARADDVIREVERRVAEILGLPGPLAPFLCGIGMKALDGESKGLGHDRAP